MAPPPLLAIVGATATGKSELAVALAGAVDGEVVSADAYQVYRGLDIGTAKPSAEMRSRSPHHLIDILDPDEPLTLARYLDLAQAAVADIWSRCRLPILAGGSGQYVWAVLEGWQVPRVPPDRALRAELEAFAAEHGAEALHRRLAEADPKGAARLDPNNVRRVVRALEVGTRTGLPLAACQSRVPIAAEVLILGLRCSRDDLHCRIDARVEQMYATGLVEEVGRLRAAGYGEAAPVRGGIGYKEASAYLDCALTLAEAIERTKTGTHRLVRKQAAWFKAGDARIRWVELRSNTFEKCLDIARNWLAVLAG